MTDSCISITKSRCCTSLFLDFRRLVDELSQCNIEKGDKVEILKCWLANGENDFISDLHLWCKLLVPQITKGECKIVNKQLIRIFSELFNIEYREIADFVCGTDISKAIKYYFENNDEFCPAVCSTLTIKEVSRFLDTLGESSTHKLRLELFKAIIPTCTANDLQILIRLVKRNLRINVGPKQLLEALHPEAYKQFRTCKDLHLVLQTLVGLEEEVKKKEFLMTPICPMLAVPCKSIDYAINKHPEGLYAEIKYNGERTQVHKKCKQLAIYSRNLKPTDPQKVEELYGPICEAFQNVEEIIIDSELVEVDMNLNDNTPFCLYTNDSGCGDYCLVVFDCIYIDGVILTNAPLRKRRKILEETIVEIKNKVILSEKELVETKMELSHVVAKAINAGVEGIMLKDICGIYTPGKRQWLKIKKDYLYEGKLPDTADLIVLGAWFGTGKYSHMMCRFLMGCYDETNNVFVTVAEVKNGIDKDMLLQLQTELQMERIDQHTSKCPKWLYVSTMMLPDFVAKDPTKQPVWEISGAEFTQHEIHTADGISLRFPKLVRVRDDKTWEEATNLSELKVLVTMSAKRSVFQMLQSCNKNTKNPYKRQCDTFHYYYHNYKRRR